MEIYAKGQLSYLILNCLLERDYYGLDIITEVKERSNGRIQLKKPSVYSNLTRMEKQGQVSSYVQNSDLGPNRRYYSITEKGRNTYASLKDYFDRSGIDVFKDFVGEDTPSPVIANPPVNEEKVQTVEENDFFDFSSIDNAEKQEEASQDDGKFLTNEEKVEPKPIENIVEQSQSPVQKQYSIASLLKQEEKNEEPEEDKQHTEKIQLSNQQIYDISKDFNKYKRQRSFAEDQMAFAVEDSLVKDDEKTKRNIEELKTSILANKDKYYNEKLSEEQFNTFKERTSHSPIQEQTVKDTTGFTFTDYISNTNQVETPIDDGVFITKTVSNSEAAKARKIEPPRLKIVGDKETPLPAPKKDNSIDLSHKEIISKLYSKSKGKDASEAIESVEDAIYDYDDLQDHYKSQGISFRIYEKTSYVEKHNTNKLNLITSLICLGLSLVSTAVLFTIFYLTGHTMIATNFLYLLLPAIIIIKASFRYYYYKHRTSWEPKPMLSQWYLWIFTILGIGLIVGLNFIFGMTVATTLDFSNTLFLPIVYVLIYLPVHYYIKKSLFIKHWK